MALSDLPLDERRAYRALSSLPGATRAEILETHGPAAWRGVVSLLDRGGVRTDGHPDRLRHFLTALAARPNRVGRQADGSPDTAGA